MTSSSVVVDYDPLWVRDFATVREYLGEVAKSTGAYVEHVGSTAVPGLAAKPIIDIDLVIQSADLLAQTVVGLGRCGYGHQGDLGICGREAFVSPPGLAEHHLYVVVGGSSPHRDHVDLRDYLRVHPVQARLYGNDKKRLAHLLTSDREAYAQGKAQVIHELLAAARS